MFGTIYRGLLCALHFSLVSSAAIGNQATEPAVSIPYQFSDGTWIENAAMRANGDILVTLLDRPEVQLLPAATGHKTAQLVHHFPNATGVLGITEVCPDEFAVLVGKFDLDNAKFIPRTFSVWTVSNLNTKEIKATKVADIPDIGGPNGMATVNSGTGTIVIGDSVNGKLWEMNINDGQYRVALDDETMKPAEDAIFPFGVNGVRVHVEDQTTFIYFANMGQSTLVRVPVDPYTAEAIGEYEVTNLADGTTPDDFAVSRKGVVYVANNAENDVLRVGTKGNSRTIVGAPKKKIVASATSAVLGRTPWDEHTLYVVTGGGRLVEVHLDEL